MMDQVCVHFMKIMGTKDVNRFPIPFFCPEESFKDEEPSKSEKGDQERDRNGLSSDEEEKADVAKRGGGSRQSLIDEESDNSTPEKPAKPGKYHGTGLGSTDDSDSSDDDFRTDLKNKQNDEYRTGLETDGEDEEEGGDAGDYGLGASSEDEQNEVCYQFPLL